MKSFNKFFNKIFGVFPYGNSMFLIYIPVLIIVFSGIVSILSKQSLLVGLCFALFQIFGIMVPGYTILKITKLDAETDIKCVGVSYFLGYISNMLIYLCIVPFHLQNYAPFIMMGIVVICLIYLFVSYRKKKIEFEIERDRFGMCVCSTFIIVYLLLDFFMYAIRNAIPPMLEANVIYGDVAYWIGNAIELTKEFPPKNFRAYPNSYNYHYFSSMQIALMSMVTKIKPITIAVVYHYIQPVFLIVFGAYILFKEYAKRNSAVVIGVIVLLFSSGFENIAIVTYREHMFDNPFGFDYGMGIFLFYLYILLKIYYTENFSGKYCIASLFCFACLVGVKAPYAAIALAGTGIMSLHWLFGKQWKKAFLIGMPTLLIFIALYFGVVNMRGYGGGDALSVISQTAPVEKGEISVVKNVVEEIPVVGEIILLLIYGVMSNPTIFLMILLTVSVSFIKKRRLAKGSIALFIMIIVAELVTLFMGMIGNSQMYFIMCAFPIGVLVYVLNVDEELKNKLYQILLTGIILLGIIRWNVGYDTQATDMIKANISKLKDSGEVDLSQNYSISTSQMEAYEWLKIHLEPNAMVFSNKGDGIIGIIGECYLYGGTDLFNSSSQTEQDRYIEQVKSLNCVYIVHDIAKAPDFEMLSDMCSVVFSNESTVIYEIE